MAEAMSDADNLHGTLIADAAGVIRYCSAALGRAVRRRPDELVGTALAGVLPGYALADLALPGGVSKKDEPAPCAMQAQPISLHLATAEGRHIPVNVLGCTLPCEPVSLLVLEIWTSGGKLEHHPELQRLAWSVEKSSDAVVITDADGLIEYVNPAFESMSGFAGAEALGKTPAILKSGHHTRDFYRELWETLRSGAEFRGVLVNRKKSGELFHEEKVIRPFFGASGRISHFVSIGRDSTDRIRAMEKLTHAATHDSLTGLPNRQLFFDRLGQALRQATRRGSGLGVAVIDVDRFKQINDSLGHFAGDAVLRAVASRLARSVREADIVGRLGGDEFGLVLLDVAEPGTLAPVLAKIERTFEAPVELGERSIRVSLSIGACLHPAAGSSERELMHCADAAMYEAKRGGGGRYRIARAREAPHG
jgi:diguanylate cyclase (GGDEF)-like protein/PAS domain S-box-containing protein